MTTKRLLAIAVGVALFVAYAVATGGSDTTTANDRLDGTTTTLIAARDGNDTEVESDGVRFSTLPVISLEQLPFEALDTLDLIENAGPYPFDRDDLVFQNREGLLPDRDLGHYREYTVITPGENDRGARRIVAGDDGERYYTADHYRSFAEIVFD